MNSLTCWCVYQCKKPDNTTTIVLVGLDTTLNRGIVEPVYAHRDGQINDYQLYGAPNDHWVGYQQLWTQYCTQHGINDITDISYQFKY
jgi:hypothetical protein